MLHVNEVLDVLSVFSVWRSGWRVGSISQISQSALQHALPGA